MTLFSLLCVRGDELAQPLGDDNDGADESMARAGGGTGTAASAVASGAPGDAKRRALDNSEAETVDKIRQPASLQVSLGSCFPPHRTP
jgi:hypothetical protein